jgi:hypothetical protein
MVCLRNAAGRLRLQGGRPLHALRGAICRGRIDTLTTTIGGAEAFGACGGGVRMMHKAPHRGGGRGRRRQGLRTPRKVYMSCLPAANTRQRRKQQLHLRDAAATMTTTPL